MDVQTLMQRLNQLLRAGKIEETSEVMVRNPHVSDRAIEAGSNGWIEADELLVAEGNFLIGPMEE